MPRNVLSYIAAAALAIGMLVNASPAQTQGGSGRSMQSVSVVGGAFNYDVGGDTWYPMVGARIGRELSRMMVAEVGLSYAATATEGFRTTPHGPTLDEISTPIVTADVGLQLQLPLPHVRPYAGIAVGALRRSGNDGIESHLGLSYSAMGGLRLGLSDRIGLRGELRVRQDEHRDFTATNLEQTIGISVRL